MSHASIPHDDTLQTEPLAADLVRLSVGIEDIRDLIDDLRQAFDVAEKLGTMGLDVESVKEVYRGPRSAEEALIFDASASENMLFDSTFEDLPVVPALPSEDKD